MRGHATTPDERVRGVVVVVVVAVVQRYEFS
jgi:hypothetical protein